MRAIHLILFSLIIVLSGHSLAIPGNERGGGGLPEGETKKLIEYVKRQIFEAVRSKSVPLACKTFDGGNLSYSQIHLCSLINQYTLSQSYRTLLNHPSAEFGNTSDALNLFEAQDRFEVSGWILGEPEIIERSEQNVLIYTIPVSLDVRVFDCMKPIYLNLRLNWDGENLLF